MADPSIDALIDREPYIIELDGPPKAFFEIPLEYWATPNGELEAPGHRGAARLIQRIEYVNFMMIGKDKAACLADAGDVVVAVKRRLKQLGGGYIWWRLRPQYQDPAFAAAENAKWQVRLRLGTTPELPLEFWKALSAEVGNRSTDAPKTRLCG